MKLDTKFTKIIILMAKLFLSIIEYVYYPITSRNWMSSIDNLVIKDHH